MKSRRTAYPGAAVKDKEEMVRAFVIKILQDSDVWPIVRVGVSTENFLEQGDGLGSFLSGDAAKPSASIFESSSTAPAKAKPKGEFFGRSGVDAKPWSCGACTYVNKASRLTCEICGEANKGGVHSTASFVCPKCTFENKLGAQECEICREKNGSAPRRRYNETEETTMFSPAKKKKTGLEAFFVKKN